MNKVWTFRISMRIIGILLCLTVVTSQDYQCKRKGLKSKNNIAASALKAKIEQMIITSNLIDKTAGASEILKKLEESKKARTQCADSIEGFLVGNSIEYKSLLDNYLAMVAKNTNKEGLRELKATKKLLKKLRVSLRSKYPETQKLREQKNDLVSQIWKAKVALWRLIAQSHPVFQVHYDRYMDMKFGL